MLGRMTLPEKAGLLFHAPVAVTADGGFVEEPAGPLPTAPTTDVLRERHVRCLSLMAPVSAGPLSRWHNEVQRMAAEAGWASRCSSRPIRGTRRTRTR
jgi:beta-glucosidase